MSDIITIEEEVIVVTVEEEAIQVVIASVGEQGPPGTGAGVLPGGDADEVLTKIDSVEQNAEWRTPDGRAWKSSIADNTISALKVVRRTATGVDVSLANDFDQLKAAVGVAYTAAASGNSLIYQMYGEITDGSWFWTVGAKIFVTDSGDLSETYGTHLRSVGIALNATTILLDFGPAIRR